MRTPRQNVWKCVCVCQHVSTIGACRQIAEVVIAEVMTSGNLFNSQPIQLAVWSLVCFFGLWFMWLCGNKPPSHLDFGRIFVHQLYSCCMTRRCPLHPNFPKVLFHKKTSPQFQFKPPVSLSGTPPGRPWTKQETNNSTIQIAATTPWFFDDRCRFAVEFAWDFLLPHVRFLLWQQSSPQKKQQDGRAGGTE